MLTLSLYLLLAYYTILANDLLTMGSRTLKEKQGRLCSSASCSACSVTPTWLGVRLRVRVRLRVS